MYLWYKMLSDEEVFYFSNIGVGYVMLHERPAEESRACSGRWRS